MNAVKFTVMFVVVCMAGLILYPWVGELAGKIHRKVRGLDKPATPEPERKPPPDAA